MWLDYSKVENPAGFMLALMFHAGHYLASSKCGQYVDIGILASDLQKTYR
uniref:Uncharacterized protein n=1 Tax=Cyanistes caeruleus TaxID=156563 RepID=A0A8C0Z8V0_CYACU